MELAGRAAQAVTQRARLALPQDDEEELEYAAMWWAAESPGTGRVVVAALDVPAGWVRAVGGEDPDHGFEVAVDAPLPRRRLVALHVEETQEAEAAQGAQDAQGDLDGELSWYDAGELAQVAALDR